MNIKRVFIVDDDRLIQNLLEYTFIGKEGYDVNVYSNAETCLGNLNKKPDIIILDHGFMGKEETLMTGLEALEKIKELDASIPVIILSAMNDQKLIDVYYAKGANDYISKEGFFINSLFESIESIINKAKVS